MHVQPEPEPQTEPEPTDTVQGLISHLVVGTLLVSPYPLYSSPRKAITEPVVT